MHDTYRLTRRENALAIMALALTPFIWPLGVALIWASPAWNRRDKLIGTLLPPGGYLPVWLMETQERTACNIPLNAAGQVTGNYTCPAAPLHYGPPEVVHIVGGVLLVVLLVLPVLTAIYIAYRLRQYRRSLATIAAEGI